MEYFPSKGGKEPGFVFLSFLLKIVLHVLPTTVKQEQELKLSLFADYIIFIENPMESRKLLELISELNTVAPYKNNTQKINHITICYLLTRNMWNWNLKMQYYLQLIPPKYETFR